MYKRAVATHEMADAVRFNKQGFNWNLKEFDVHNNRLTSYRDTHLLSAWVLLKMVSKKVINSSCGSTRNHLQRFSPHMLELPKPASQLSLSTRKIQWKHSTKLSKTLELQESFSHLQPTLLRHKREKMFCFRSCFLGSSGV